MSNWVRVWLVGLFVILRGKLFTLPHRGRSQHAAKHRLTPGRHQCVATEWTNDFRAHCNGATDGCGYSWPVEVAPYRS